MPRIERPSPLDIFICIRSGIDHIVEVTPRIEYPQVKPEQWTAIFPDNSRVYWNTHQWAAFDMFHPKGWVKTGAYYYPVDCEERFPQAQPDETFKNYVERLKHANLEGLDQLKEAQLKTIFTKKSGVLKAAEAHKEKIKKAKAANPKKSYPPLALPG